MRTTVWGLAFIAAGVYGLANRLTYWASCIAQSENASNFAALDSACRSLIGDATLAEAAFSVGLIPLVIAIGAVASAKGKIQSRIALTAFAAVLFLGPIIDPGFWWQEWVFAEAPPGNGVLSSLIVCAVGGAVILAGVLFDRTSTTVSIDPEPARVSTVPQTDTTT